MKTTITGLVVGLVLFAASLSPRPTGAADVKTYEAYEQIDEHNQLPLNPYPPFGLSTGYICYPYQFYGNQNFQVTPRKLRLLVAENEYLKIAMCPDYGGRLYYMYDKIGRREVIHRIYTSAKFCTSGMGLQYLGGGLELNIPNAHSQTNARPRECVARKNADGSVSLIMNNTEQIGRIHWSVAFTLSPGEARVRQQVRIANETAVEARYLYWANCGIPLKENTEFIYPETKGAMHGRYNVVFSWPTYEGANLGLIKNVDEALGVYMLEAREGYFGYFSHDDRAGMVHYGDASDLPGKKYWSWGWNDEAKHTRYTHTDGRLYGEVQSGRIVIQEQFDRLPPLTSQVWTEYWYPIGDIGVFNGASENAAVNFSVTGKPENKAAAAIKIHAATAFEDVSLLIKSGAKTVQALERLILRPEKPLVVSTEFGCAAGDLNRISLEVRTGDGRTIAEVWPKVKKAKPFDSYFIAEHEKQAKAEDFTPEGVFAKAEALARDWFYHLPEQKKLLEKCLQLDPSFSRANTELGLMALQAGQFEQALARFDRSLERISDDARTLYYKGLALRYLGRPEDAHYYLRHAGRFGYEAPERIIEAEMAIQAGNLDEADRHLARANAANGTVLKGFLLRALVQKRLGRADAARQLFEQAKAIDPENASIACVQELLDTGPRASPDPVMTRYRSFPEEVLEVVATLYSAGLNREAYDIVCRFVDNSFLVRLYRAELESLLNISSGPRAATPAEADFAWRLEEFLGLKNQLKRHPKDGELYWQLGNFAYAHDLAEEGIANWKKAYNHGCRDKRLLYLLYRAEKGRNPDSAFVHLQEAMQQDAGDPYLFENYVAEIRKRKGPSAAIELLETNIGRFPNCLPVHEALMREYLGSGQYDKLEQMCMRTKFDNARQSLGRHWETLKMVTGYRKLKENRYQEALADFRAAGNVPERLQEHYLSQLPTQARRLFYIGYCQSKLGRADEAKKTWLAAMDLQRHIRFEAHDMYRMMQTRFYQAYCLRGLGSDREADVLLESIKEFAASTALANASPSTKKQLLSLAYIGRKFGIDDFRSFDSERGVDFSGITTSVER